MDISTDLSNLLPHLSYLQEEILEIYTNDDEYNVVARELELLPYSYNCASYSLFQLLELAVEGTNKCLANIEKEGHYVGLPHDIRNKMSFNIDAFFDSSRRTQNALVPYLSRALSRSMPMSLSDVVKKINKNKIVLDNEISWTLTEYWKHSGEKIKDYRDLLQHHAILYPEATACINNEGKGVLLIYLPNNPKEKSLSRLKYTEPSVNAINYLIKELYSLTKLCYLTTKLITKNRDIGKLIVHRTIFQVPLGMGSGVVIGSSEEIKTRLKYYASTLGDDGV